MSAKEDELEIIAGMIAVETPQQRARRMIDLMERGEVDRVRALIEARAARVAEQLARELASMEAEAIE